jgi:hypothetical protein
MTNNREENYEIIYKRIKELVDLLENGANTLPHAQRDDFVQRIT